jgi:tetratricopeptide (TPR) repeat protein
LVVIVSWVVAPVGAQQEDDRSFENVETEIQESMRNDVYQELAKAQTQAEAGQYREAVRLLDALREEEDLNSYELAQAWNLYAYIYYAQDNYEKAISAYERLLGQPELPQALEASTVQTLSQLYFVTSRWPKAIEMLERRLAADDDPEQKIYEMLAQAHYQNKSYRQALAPAKKAIELTLTSGEQPDENLYVLLRVLHYELGQLDEVESVLGELIRRYPKRQYWMQLVSLYGEMGDEDKQLRALELAHMQGFLTTQTQVVTLASLLLKHDLPYKAGKVLASGLEDGVIEGTKEHWRLLAQAWTLAQEHEKAIPALKRAAGMSEDGELEVILAQSYINLDRHEEAIEALRTALRKGGLRRPDQAQIMLGQTLFQLERFAEAREAFEAAQSDSRSGQLASQWLRHIEREVDRKSQLASAVE